MLDSRFFLTLHLLFFRVFCLAYVLSFVSRKIERGNPTSFVCRCYGMMKRSRNKFGICSSRAECPQPATTLPGNRSSECHIACYLRTDVKFLDGWYSYVWEFLAEEDSAASSCYIPSQGSGKESVNLIQVPPLYAVTLSKCSRYPKFHGRFHPRKKAQIESH